MVNNCNYFSDILLVLDERTDFVAFSIRYVYDPQQCLWFANILRLVVSDQNMNSLIDDSIL